ncbi:MAG TPA: 2-oxoacid:acceptor oxidoreductase family protein [Candidatus Eisenbacteria bacterium]|nr:2-oxoacid:acceptor oxidoreductase family protein [Candidatus Eisenbacteria bacterium]
MEREIVFTGIGGQGIQLMAKVLAQAAADEGRHAMLFGVYHGAMRGSPSDSTLVIGDAPIEAPPIVPACWSVVAMHPRSLEPLLGKLRPDGLLFTNETLVPPPPHDGARLVPIPATRLAEEAGSPMGAGMIMLGGFVAHTTIVAMDRVVAAMRAALPAHRARMADANAALLARGADWARGPGAVAGGV